MCQLDERPRDNSENLLLLQLILLLLDWYLRYRGLR